MSTRLLRGLPRAGRLLQRRGEHSSSGAAHLGVLHVYKLELAERPTNGKRLRLLFPSGAPQSMDDSAQQLAAAAERGEPVLVPERALHRLFAADAATLSLSGSEHEARALPAASTEATDAAAS